MGHWHRAQTRYILVQLVQLSNTNRSVPQDVVNSSVEQFPSQTFLEKARMAAGVSTVHKNIKFTIIEGED